MFPAHRVVHAEGCGNQHSVMNFKVGCTQTASMGNVFRCHILAAALHFACDDEAL